LEHLPTHRRWAGGDPPWTGPGSSYPLLTFSNFSKIGISRHRQQPDADCRQAAGQVEALINPQQPDAHAGTWQPRAPREIETSLEKPRLPTGWAGHTIIDKTPTHQHTPTPTGAKTHSDRNKQKHAIIACLLLPCLFSSFNAFIVLSGRSSNGFSTIFVEKSAMGKVITRFSG
jgi:hypothetical protein